MNPGDDGKTGKRRPRAVRGGRATLERQLMWAVALGSDPRRIEQLNRMLEPAANDKVTLDLTCGLCGTEHS